MHAVTRPPQAYEAAGAKQLGAAAVQAQLQRLADARLAQLPALLAGQDLLLLYLRAAATLGKDRLYARPGERLSELAKHVVVAGAEGGGGAGVVGPAERGALLARGELLRQLWLWLLHREWEVSRWVRGRSSKVCCKEGGAVRALRAQLERQRDAWAAAAAARLERQHDAWAAAAAARLLQGRGGGAR
jgi:hypothetical protein